MLFCKWVQKLNVNTYLPTTFLSDRRDISHVNELAVYAGLVNVRHAVCDAKSCRENGNVGVG